MITWNSILIKWNNQYANQTNSLNKQKKNKAAI